MPKPLESEVYEFGDFRLDARSYRLFRGAERVSLTPKAAEVLIALVRAAGRVVSKEELLDTVWGGAFVEDANLSQSIFLLRKALGEDKNDPRFLLTLPNRGYQFIAAVTETKDAYQIGDREYNRFERRGTANTAAYESYVRGRFFWNKRTSESLKKAIEHFEASIIEDPNFAQAYAGLADSHQLLADYYAAALPKGTLQKVKAAATQAHEIDDQLAQAHTSLAYAQAFYDWDWAGADKSFNYALELNPNNATAHQWYADYLGVIGRFDESLAHIERAIELDPDSAAIAAALAGFHYTQRDANQIIKAAKQVIRLDPTFAYGQFYLGFGYEFKGLGAQAVEAFAKAAELFGEPAECGEELKAAYRQNGMTGVWNTRLEQYATRPHLENYPTYLKSLVPIRLGDRETSLAWLNQAYEQRDRGIIYAKYEPILEPLRDDPRFQDLLHRLGLG
jgi:DNA-binding winged helix-turn-helix (wHTH) protein